MTPSAPPPSFPLALEDDADDVAWALRTAGVEWNRGARADALEWLLRAVDTAIDAGRIERAREIQRNINDLSSSLRSSPAPGPSPASVPPSRRPRTSSMPPLPPPPGFEEALEAETIDVDMDVDVELDEEAEEVESLEVLDAEVLDEEEEAPEEATTQWSVPSGDELEEEDLEAIDSGLEVMPESIRIAEEPPPFASEPPTVQNQLAAQGDIPLPLDFEDEPLADPATLPPGPVRPQPLPRFTEVEPATTAVIVEQSPDSLGTVPESASKPEPFHRSPSFGDHLAPPASVVLRAANAILDAEPTIPPAAPARSSAPPSASPVPPRASPVPPPMPQRRSSSPVSEAPPRSAREPSLPPPPGFAPQPVASDAPPSLLGIDLAEVRGLEDLPEESQQDLSRKVRIHALEVDEEVTGFGLALVLSGKVAVMPAIMDVVCVRAGRGELIFAESHVEEGVTLKVVAAEPGTRVAAWPIEQFAEAIAPCPWVRDELRGVGDRLQAFAGAAMGQMGEQLDELLRGMVFDRCSVKLLLPDEAVATAGKPLAGMTIVGAGRLQVSDKDGNPVDELGPGDIVYASEMLRAAPAPANVKAAEGGALIVFAERKTAHELMMSVPPLIEVLSS
jgi:CRP-like cAMP-binding protein